jgi:hypothetical protein
VFKGKVVVVGGIAVGTGDSKATPLESATPGLIKQAAVLDNLLHDAFVIEAPLWVSVLFGFFVALFSVCLVLVVRNTFIDIGWPVLLYVGFFLVTGGVLVTTRGAPAVGNASPRGHGGVDFGHHLGPPVRPQRPRQPQGPVPELHGKRPGRADGGATPAALTGRREPGGDPPSSRTFGGSRPSARSSRKNRAP